MNNTEKMKEMVGKRSGLSLEPRPIPIRLQTGSITASRTMDMRHMW